MPQARGNLITLPVTASAVFARIAARPVLIYVKQDSVLRSV